MCLARVFRIEIVHRTTTKRSSKLNMFRGGNNIVVVSTYRFREVNAENKEVSFSEISCTFKSVNARRITFVNY